MQKRPTSSTEDVGRAVIQGRTVYVPQSMMGTSGLSVTFANTRYRVRFPPTTAAVTSFASRRVDTVGDELSA